MKHSASEIPQENEWNQSGPAVSHRYFQQLVQALPFLQGMASRNGFSGLFSPFDADPFLFLATQVQGSVEIDRLPCGLSL